MAILMAGVILTHKIFFYSPDLSSGTAVLRKNGYAVKCRLRPDEVKRLKKSWRWLRPASIAKPREPSQYLLSQGGVKISIWRTAGIAYDNTENVFFVLNPDACRALDNGIVRLENNIADRYCQLIPWEQARQYFPRYGKAEIIDIKTGKSFRVQRRAGSYHADCQPLTLADTKVMKEIYGGKWSWQRRAVIVAVDGKRIAASMAGQPHGAGAISGNGFPGHFCVHFWGSRVHASGRVDKKHARMILEAAGKV
jgi:hypothetical protein